MSMGSDSNQIEIKIETNDDHDDDEIEILNEITNLSNQTRNLMYSTSIAFKSEFNSTNHQAESKMSKNDKIKKLEQIQETLLERIRLKTNKILIEYKMLKQNETNLIAKNIELNNIIEIKTNNEIKLSNEINDLKIKIEKYDSKVNETNKHSEGN